MFTYMDNYPKVVIVSNVFSHHQQPISDALYAIIRERFAFVETLGLTQELKNLGYKENSSLPYLHRSYSDQADICRSLIMAADVVLFGGAPESMIRERIKEGKLVFRCSERPLKHGPEPLKYIPRFVKWHLRNPVKKPIFLLCASGYAAADYGAFGLFRGKSYKWGYFPPVRHYEDINILLEKKEKKRILWCGRFLDWKHPDDALRVACELKDAGEDFSLDYVGTGPMDEELHRLCAELQLEDRVHFLGPMSPDGVRDEMERAGIVLMTSDRQEGWGAVLNEAMNSGCAVICSHAVGAAPFLVENGMNGILYPSGDLSALSERLRSLLSMPERQKALGAAAYRTIAEQWNAETAARRLIALTQRLLLCGNLSDNQFQSGPASRAEIIRDDWYRSE